MKLRYLSSALALVGAFFVQSIHAHGDVTPQAVNTETLKQLGEEWLMENPYRGDKEAIKIGSSAYNQNCARCHGLEVISGGIAPDLRKLNDENEFSSPGEADEWFMERIRGGAVINGRILMPPFEGLISQEGMWAIKSYIETRPLTD